jgi:hypothetical protein
MKKLFIITLAVLFAAGTAYAVEYDWSGMINTRGSYIDNSGSTSDDSYDYMIYDMEFDSTLNINPTDKTLIRLNWEIHDENFTGSPQSSQDLTGKGNDDDQIAFKRAWGKYTFDNGWSTSFGLMTGGAFGTAFGDNADGYYRVRADGSLSFGKVGFILEKVEENGNLGDSDWDAEADDSDAYAAYFVTKAGDITLNFLLKYAQIGNATPLDAAAQDDPLGFEDEGSDIDIIAGVVAAMGTHGQLGWEAEFMFKDYTMEGNDIDLVGGGQIDDTREDYTVYGLYGNIWYTMDALKIGGMAAYGSYDDDGEAGFGFGEDFGPGFWVMDWDAFGDGNAEYYAATLVAVYADYSISDALSVYGAFEYMSSNSEDDEWDGAKGYIIDASLSYKLADNVKYTVAGAYGQYSDGEWDDGAGDTYDDPDAFARVYHKIQINF